MLGNLHVPNGTARRSCNSLTSWVTGLSEFLGWVGSGTLTNGISFAIRGENPSSTDERPIWYGGLGPFQNLVSRPSAMRDLDSQPSTIRSAPGQLNALDFIHESLQWFVAFAAVFFPVRVATSIQHLRPQDGRGVQSLQHCERRRHSGCGKETRSSLIHSSFIVEGKGRRKSKGSECP